MKTAVKTDIHPLQQNKVALVTGGAKRVGRAVALELARAGMDVAITFQSSRSEAMSVVDEIKNMGRKSAAIRVDFSKPHSTNWVKKKFLRRFDRLDALINCASIFSPTPLAKLTSKEFDRYLAINARSPLFLTQAFAELLGKHFNKHEPASMGRVVNFIDIHVMGQTLRNFAAYSASKAALMEITSTCALVLAPRVTVNAIAPGVIAWAESYTAKQREDYLKRVPLGRAGTPEDAAKAVKFLVCDAHYCTGQIIKLDGGRFLT